MQLAPGGDDQTAVQTAFIQAKPGSTICLAAGKFSFTTELSLTVDGVTVTGAGQGKTILDSSGQTVGGNGLSILADGAVIQDLDVRNTPGDGIRADSVEGITFQRVSVIWEADASVDNGGSERPRGRASPGPGSTPIPDRQPRPRHAFSQARALVPRSAIMFS